MGTVVMPSIGNNGYTLLNGSINASVTTITVDSAAALTLDNSKTDAYITVIDPTTFGKNPFSTPETQEIMRVTGVSTNAITVERGADGTSATSFADNSYVMLRNNAATLQRVYDALTDGTDTLNFPGITGDFDVGGLVVMGEEPDTGIHAQAESLSVGAASHCGISISINSTGATENIFFQDKTHRNGRITVYGGTHGSANQMWIYSNTQVALKLDASQDAILTADLTVEAGGEVFLNLPTSAGTPGSLWNDSGTVKVA